MIRKYIASEFERRKSKNKRYSIRGFARDLQLEPSVLAKILKGTRPVKPQTAVKILTRLDLDQAQRNTLLLSLFPENKQSYLTDRDFVEVSGEAEEEAAMWEFFAILSLAEIPGFAFDPEWVSKRIGTSAENAGAVLCRLAELGLLINDGGEWKASGATLTTKPGIQKEVVMEAQRQCLAKSVEVLLSQEDHALSDFSGMTIAVSSEKLPEAVRRIKEFRRSLAAFLQETDKPDHVYRLGIQLFPMTVD